MSGSSGNSEDEAALAGMVCWVFLDWTRTTSLFVIDTQKHILTPNILLQRLKLSLQSCCILEMSLKEFRALFLISISQPQWVCR